MDLTSLTSSDLKKITSLIEKKAKLVEQISEIDKELGSFGGASSAPASVSTMKKRGRKPGSTNKTSSVSSAPKSAKKAGRKGGSGRRGAVRDAILAILHSAGPDGAAVRDIASQLDQKPANIHAWFQATGKKTPEIRKVGKGAYAWVG
jgi:hypothetical protein